MTYEHEIKPSSQGASMSRSRKLSPLQKLHISLLLRLEELVDDFNQQGAENQSTQLSGLLDDYHMAVEELESSND